jgi:uncharacterized repeat protein (TIGR01451 family)/MYXO-CTERM domain-containing protein
VSTRKPIAALGGVGCLVAGGVLAACSTQSPPPDAERTAKAGSALFVNGGFEADTNNQKPSSWTVTTYQNKGVTLQSPQTRAGLNLQAGGTELTKTLVAAGGPESEPDPTLGTNASLRWPKFGNAVAIVNQQGKDYNVNSLKQTMTVDAGDIDSADGLAHVRFALAPVLEDPGHADDQQPYFFVQLTNLTKGKAILYQDFNFANQPGVPWKQSGTIRYTDWALVDIAPGSAKLGEGDQVELEIIAAGCSRNGHWGHVYVDGAGPTVPGLFVSGTGPSAANQNTDITYTLSYKNGGVSAAGGVVIEFNTPAKTTFRSVNAPGLTCTTPAVGSAGVVRCTVGALAAGSGGSFPLTVRINNNTAPTVITAGNYSISGTGISPLLGPKIFTNVTSGVTYANLGVTMTSPGTTVPAGASVTYTIEVTNTGPSAATGATVADTLPAQLVNATWTCVGSGGATCTASGSGSINDSATSIPVGGKLVYTITATVSPNAPAGQLENVATVSVPAGATDPDPFNNSVGNRKHITVANGVTCGTPADCTSGVCATPSNLCGYPDGQGPCTAANGSVVCRSGACSSDGTCMPSGGCNVDADCTGGNWCSISTHTCTAKVPNGNPVPTDPGHTSPTLNGTCSAAAATLTCVSEVCANDNLCGYPNGTGPCTSANAATVCRSGACSANGTCMPPAGCNADADCTGGKWCSVSTHACTDKIANGGPMPTDPGHTSPTLDGSCSPAAATLTCVSGVCDAVDHQCGYADGSGPCTGATASDDCRSGACSSDGTCMPSGGCNTDADCTGGNWCSVSTHTCTAKVPNGAPVPTDPGHTTPTLDGNCTTAAGALTCASGVCDAKDDKCGYPDGTGPCTAANGVTVCRSGSCSATGVCKPKTACNVDADCDTRSQFCDTGKHECTAKLANGTPMPSVSGHAPVLDGTCSNEAAAVVCESGVCDPADNKCGYGNGVGPCSSENASTVCRSGACDPADNKCGLNDGAGPCSSDITCRTNRCNKDKRTCGAGCTSDSDCSATEFCKADGACSPKLPDGDTCTDSNQCMSDACNAQVCDSVSAAGNGIGCAVQSGSDSRDGMNIGAAAFGLALVGFARRRRRTGSNA